MWFIPQQLFLLRNKVCGNIIKTAFGGRLMNIWKILGIDKTKDKEKLKKAYRIKLVSVNPEDDPEGFMELRHAYEEAVRQADMEDKPKDTSPMGQLATYIEELYKDFYRRIDVEEWKELFNRDEFVSLDTSEDAFKVLMKFLMENFYIPQTIWKLLVETFDIKDRKKELAEIYPEDFLDYMINNSMYDDLINYYLFDGDYEDFEEFIGKYFKLDLAIRKRDRENQSKYFKELDELNVSHPYVEINRIRHSVQVLHDKLKEKFPDDESKTLCSEFFSELESLQEKALGVVEDFPEDVFILLCCGDIASLREDYDMAKEYYDRAASIKEDNYIVKGKMADLEYHLGNFEKSRDMYMELLKINHYDNNVRAGMIRANQGIIDKMSARIKEDPTDNKARMEMAWSLYQSYRFNEVIALLDEFEPTEDKVCEYNNVKGRSFLCLFDYDNAISCFLKWKEAIEAIPEEATDKDNLDKKKRWPYVMFLISDCYLKTKKYDEARKYLDISLGYDHDEKLLSYEAKCELEYLTENYDECIKACEALIEKDDRDYIAYSFMSKACYELDYIKESMVACEKAIAIYPYVSEPYVQEIKIYVKFGQDDNAKKIVERFKVMGIESDNVEYYEAYFYEKEENYEKALQIVNNILRRGGPEESDMEEYVEIYVLKGVCHEKLQDYDKAAQCYIKAIELDDNHKTAHGRLGIVYKNQGKFADALKELDRQMEINASVFFLIHRGIINRAMSNNKSALRDFTEALKYEPDNVYCHSKVGLIYEQHREFAKAVDSYTKAIDALDEKDNEQRWQLYMFKARALQCMKKFDESLEIYDIYIEEAGLNADIGYDYSVLLERLGRMEDAVAVLNKCIDALPYDSLVQSCIRRLCELYGSNGYLDKANEAFMLAVSKDANDMKAYTTMADIFSKHGLYEDAQQLYEKAIKLDINNKENYYSELIDVILSKRTLFKSDIKPYLNKAIIEENKLNNPVDLIKMARLHKALKKYKKACEYADRAIKSVRCSGCFYERCHEAVFMKGLIYEALKQYEFARICYREAISICGKDALYEERLKRLEGKKG